jgi:glyoxylase-like metal-dependent hydrolase (beta-lactamase superfamily II)
MLPMVDWKGEKLVFMGDLIPTVGHIPLPYVMGYDVRPLQTLFEKSAFLDLAAENNYLLFLEHDPNTLLVRVHQTEKGIRLQSSHHWNEFI